MIIKKKLSEEHKRKIGLANSIALKGKHTSPRTEFKKGSIPLHKGKHLPQIQKEKAYNWKGGGHATARRILIREGIRDLNTCQICKDKGKMHIHHVDGNPRNNDNFNLGIVCSYCHNSIHDNGKETRFKEKELIM